LGTFSGKDLKDISENMHQRALLTLANANGTAVNGAGHPAPEVDDQTRREAVDELLKSLGRSKDQPKT